MDIKQKLRQVIIEDPALEDVWCSVTDFFALFSWLLFKNVLKYPYICQQANANRPEAPDIAQNRKSSYQQIHTWKAQSQRKLRTMNNELLTSIEILVIYVLIRHLSSAFCPLSSAFVPIRHRYLYAYKPLFLLIFAPIYGIIPLYLPAGKHNPPVGESFSGEPQVFVSADTRPKSSLLNGR